MEEILRERYLNPLTDFGFKRLFFSELNKDLLIDFLNEIILEEFPIIDIHYQPTIQEALLETERKATFDIFCTNERGEYYIIEMQKAQQPHFRDRCLYYASFPLQRQLLKGRKGFNLKAVYMVAIYRPVVVLFTKLVVIG